MVISDCTWTACSGTVHTEYTYRYTPPLCTDITVPLSTVTSRHMTSTSSGRRPPARLATSTAGYQPTSILLSIFSCCLLAYLGLPSCRRRLLDLAIMLCTLPAGQYLSLPDPVRMKRLATALQVLRLPSLLKRVTPLACCTDHGDASLRQSG